MDDDSDGVINLILPAGRTTEFYHSLAERLVGTYATQSALEGSLPENVPILNDSTWVLTVPLSASFGRNEIVQRLGALPDGRDIDIEEPGLYGAAARGRNNPD